MRWEERDRKRNRLVYSSTWGWIDISKEGLFCVCVSLLSLTSAVKMMKRSTFMHEQDEHFVVVLKRFDEILMACPIAGGFSLKLFPLFVQYKGEWIRSHNCVRILLDNALACVTNRDSRHITPRPFMKYVHVFVFRLTMICIDEGGEVFCFFVTSSEWIRLEWH